MLISVCKTKKSQYSKPLEIVYCTTHFCLDHFLIGGGGEVSLRVAPPAQPYGRYKWQEHVASVYHTMGISTEYACIWLGSAIRETCVSSCWHLRADWRGHGRDWVILLCQPMACVHACQPCWCRCTYVLAVGVIVATTLHRPGWTTFVAVVASETRSGRWL